MCNKKYLNNTVQILKTINGLQNYKTHIFDSNNYIKIKICVLIDLIFNWRKICSLEEQSFQFWNQEIVDILKLPSKN